MRAQTQVIEMTKKTVTDPDQRAYEQRLQQALPKLRQQLLAIYEETADIDGVIEKLIKVMHSAYQQRSPALRQLDAERLAHPDWFQSENMVGGVCYVDLYAGNLHALLARIPYFKQLGLTYLHLMPLFKAPQDHNDGGYAVSSYREVNPALGTMQDLNLLATALREAGISLVLDFIFNHTSNEHEWAQRCLANEAEYRDFYIIYPDRIMPDQYERDVREIFPQEHPGAFTQLLDGRWVWTTFHSYQWDLNYANPNVFIAMAGEMLFIANQGAEILRMDAVAFLWKQLGTVCENLPQVHQIIQAFNTVASVVAPSLLFKSEAIVHPDDVKRYISRDECQISYNPLQMALLWSTLASREVNLLEHALSHRHAIEPDCSWVNYVRSHDDIGWTFSDEDAALYAIDGQLHRKFLNDFYLNRFPGSFAQGVPFQENLKTGDCRVSGTTASLTGIARGEPYAVERVLALYNIVLTAGGIPLIYLGDEVGILNDYSYVQEPAKAEDSRWVHRVQYEEARYLAAKQHNHRPEYHLYHGLLHLIQLRKHTPALAGNRLLTMPVDHKSVLAYMREHDNRRLYMYANFCEHAVTVTLQETCLKYRKIRDLVSQQTLVLTETLSLRPYQFVWLSHEVV